MRGGWTVWGAVAVMVCVVSGTGCGSSGKKGSPVQDVGVRRSAEAQIRGRVMADMRSSANPVDGPPFRAKASCLTQTGSGSDYMLNCRATGYERPRAVRDISGIPLSREVASEQWSVRVRSGKVSALTRARGRSIGQSMTADYNVLCGDGSSSSGDPACH